MSDRRAGRGFPENPSWKPGRLGEGRVGWAAAWPGNWDPQGPGGSGIGIWIRTDTDLHVLGAADEPSGGAFAQLHRLQSVRCDFPRPARRGASWR